MTTIEINNLDTFNLLLKDSNPKERRVFVDVGGYDGDTVTKALDINPNLKVVVIEPIKSLADTIQQKFQLNKNVIVVNKAAWNNKSNIQFNEYEGWSKGLSTLQSILTHLRPQGTFTNQISKYDIKTDTLDNILSNLNINTVDYIKIDAEGSEEQILDGFTKFNNQTRFHIESHITNLENILQKILEIKGNIEKITLCRDTNIKEHVLGVVIGNFTKTDDHKKIISSHAGNDRVQYLMDRALKNKDKILNIGCTDDFMFRDTELDVMNVDIIDEIPKEYKSKIKFKIADAHNLPFKDKEFNCAILGEILEHVDDPVKVLKEAKRVAKNIYLTVPNEYDWDKILNPFQNPAHVRHYTYDSLKENLDRAYGKDNTTIIQYDGGGWSFFCAEYEPKEFKFKNENKNENIQELKITTGEYPYPKNKKYNEKLNIALISSPFFTVPPRKYGGLEQIVWDIAESLDKLGHNVTIFAPEGSKVTENGKIVYTGSSNDTVNVDWYQLEKNNYNIYSNIITPDKYDIVHGHGWFGFEYLLKLKHPNLNICHTHHGGYSWTTPPPVENPNLIAISDFMKQYTESYFQSKGFNIKSEFVRNGIDTEKYPFQKNKTDRLLFVGRLSTFKQPHIAIELAQKTNHKLDIVGGTFVDSVDYVNQLDKLIENNQNIKIYKDVTHEFKIKKMQEAKALIFPSKMNEPAGLVAMEAMSCGTPVIAFDDGAIKEYVIHNKTGFICNTLKDMIAALDNIHIINPEDCRKRAIELSKETMAKNYLDLYYRIINGNGW